HLGGKFFDRKVDVVDLFAQLRCIEIAQVRRVEVLEVSRGLYHRAATLAHFLTVDGQKAVHLHARRQIEASALEHGGPKKSMKVSDVFSDEVTDLASRILPPIFKAFTI